MTHPITIHHLFMRVSDLARARAFYVDLLGLQVLMEEPGGYLRVGTSDGFHIGIEAGDPAAVGGRGLEINLRVDDVDRVYADLVAQGVRFTAPPADQPWGARHAFFSDPDGVPLSIFSAPW